MKLNNLEHPGGNYKTLFSQPLWKFPRRFISYYTTATFLDLFGYFPVKSRLALNTSTLYHFSREACSSNEVYSHEENTDFVHNNNRTIIISLEGRRRKREYKGYIQ